MAGSVKTKAAITATFGNLTLAHSRDMTTATAGEHVSGQIQDIGFAAHEVLDIPAEIGTAKWAYFQNQDDTNFVQIGVEVAATFYPLIKLAAGEACILPLATDAVYAKANAAAVKLYFLVTEA